MAMLRTVKFPWTKAGFAESPDVVYFAEVGASLVTEGSTVFVDFFNQTDMRVWAKIGLTPEEARIMAAQLISGADAAEESHVS